MSTSIKTANLRNLTFATGLVIFLKLNLNRSCFSPCDLAIEWMISKNNGAPLLYYIKICASFQIHRSIQTGVTVREFLIQVKIGDFLSGVILKFDGWPWKTIWYPFYATLGVVHHSKAIDNFNLKLQSGNVQFGSKSAIFLSRVTLTFNCWSWKIRGHLFFVASSFVHHFIAINEILPELQSGKAQYGSKSTLLLAVWLWTNDLEKQ